MRLPIKYYFILPIIIYSQNVDMYLSLIHEGQMENVKENLPKLISKYPNDAGVIYLNALLTDDGIKSIELYKMITEKFPESKYASDASVKIGEYFFSRGLYSQACRQLSHFPRKFPRFRDMQRVMDLIVSSYKAIGQSDSARYYLSIYQGMFPYLDMDQYGLDSKFISQNKLNNKNEMSMKKGQNPYVIQIGAFGDIKNANRLKLQVNQIGYNVEVAKIQTNGKGLNAVRIVRYKTKTAAEKIGKVVKRKLGVDYRVLYRPEEG